MTLGWMIINNAGVLEFSKKKKKPWTNRIEIDVDTDIDKRRFFIGLAQVIIEAKKSQAWPSAI